jgi:molybdopterin adenylyltransferase
MIRSGLLFVPELDEAARLAVSEQLRRAMSSVHLLQLQSCPGPQRVIEEILRRWCDEEELDLVITVGGTLPAPGPSRHECVPEATLAVVERRLPGLPEAMRTHARHESILALLDRSLAGVRGRSLILNLPAGAGPATLFLAAVVDLIEPILAHLHEQPAAPRLESALAGAPTSAERVADLDDQGLAEQATSPAGKLKAAEFAAFLARSKQETAD